jgi:hypothetical protein
MPSKGGNPAKHNRSVAMANVLIKDCKEALSRPNVPTNLRTIIKGYQKQYSKAKHKTTFSGFVLAG